MAFNYQGFATLGVNLNRQKYGPLDISSVFATQADLNYYLTKGAATEGVSTYWYESADKKVVPYPYAGQLIATAFAGEAVKVWVLSEKEDGTFETKNVGDTSTVEADLSELQTAIDTINTTIGSEATDEAEATGFYKAFADLRASIEANTDAIGVKAKPESAEGADDAVEATGIYKLIEEATYDDTALANRVKAIEDDHLDSTDREEIDEAIATAAKDAEEAAVKRVLTGDDTGTIAEAYDTIKEIADWIENDESGAAKLASDVKALNTDVSTIKSDYLTSADKYDDSAIVERLDEAEAQINARTVKSADVDEFTTTDGVLAIKAIAQDKVTGLPGALSDYESRIATIEGDYLKGADKYDDTAIVERIDAIDTTLEGLTIKSADTADFTVVDGVLSIKDGKNLISDDDATKLSKLILNDDGSVTTGQKVAAGDVEGLAEWLTNNRNDVEGLFSTEDADLLALALKGITINGQTVTPGEGQIVDLPIATATALGLVKGTAAVIDDATGLVTNPNTISVKETGELEVNAISTDKLVNGAEELFLAGGSAADIPATPLA